MKTPIPIKPCPRCGSKKIGHAHSYVSDKWSLVCCECFFCGKAHKLHRKAIRRWNHEDND